MGDDQCLHIRLHYATSSADIPQSLTTQLLMGLSFCAVHKKISYTTPSPMTRQYVTGRMQNKAFCEMPEKSGRHFTKCLVFRVAHNTYAI